MSASSRSLPSGAACDQCRRRSWLLAELGGVLDCNCRADGRLFDLLALGDEDLIAALGGRRRAALRAAYSLAYDERARDGVLEVCRHDSRYPSSLCETGAARMLHVCGGIERLDELSKRPVVAFLGRGASSDYGAAIAASLARGLAISGVTVAGELANTIGATALRAALEVDAGALGAVAGGLAVGVPSRRRALFGRLTRDGCAVSELPCDAPRRRWSAVGCERVLASFAVVVLVVEADDSASGLSGARIARSFGRVRRGGAGPRRLARGARAQHATARRRPPDHGRGRCARADLRKRRARGARPRCAAANGTAATPATRARTRRWRLRYAGTAVGRLGGLRGGRRPTIARRARAARAAGAWRRWALSAKRSALAVSALP